MYRVTRCHLDTALRIIDSCGHPVLRLTVHCIMSDCPPGQVSPCSWAGAAVHDSDDSQTAMLLSLLTRCHGCRGVGAGWADTADNFTFRLL